jgi:hypothetical protein
MIRDNKNVKQLRIIEYAILANHNAASRDFRPTYCGARLPMTLVLTHSPEGATDSNCMFSCTILFIMNSPFKETIEMNQKINMIENQYEN